MQTDFSKRQRNILDLVLRMSYGCRKKHAILRPSDFELAGVGRNHIKKELKYLASANVLTVDGEVIYINKNYEQWRVSLVKSFDIDKFNEVLKRNIGVPKTGTKVPETGTVQNEEFPKQEPDSSQNGNRGVPKTGTDTPDEPSHDAVSSDPKESIKDIDRNSRRGRDIRAREGMLFQYFRQSFVIDDMNPSIRDRLISYLDDNMEPDLIMKAITITREKNKDIGYFWGILNKWFERGIKTVQTYEIAESQRRERASPNATGWKRDRGSPETDSEHSSEQGYYEQYGIVQKL